MTDESDRRNDIAQYFVGVRALCPCTVLKSILKHLDEKCIERNSWVEYYAAFRLSVFGYDVAYRAA